MTPIEFLYRRVANHIWNNHTGLITLEWLVGVLGAWLSILSLALGYGYSRCRCMRRVERIEPGTRRESYKQEARSLDNL
jgi:hypothetical protein